MNRVKIDFYKNMFYVKSYCLKAAGTMDEFNALYYKTEISLLPQFIIKKFLES